MLLVPCVASKAQANPNASDQTPTHVLHDPDNRVEFDASAFTGGVPRWENNHLITFEVDAATPSTPNVSIYGRDGRLSRQIVIWIPEAMRVFLDNVVLTTDGRILATGVADSNDGKRAAFIAITDVAGKVTSVIRTNPFLASQLCLGPDGTVWTFGDVPSTGTASAEVSAGLLRNYDFGAGLLHEFLPRSSFPASRNAPAFLSGVGKEVAMRCSQSELVIYSGPAREVIVMNFSDLIITRWKDRRSTRALPMLGFALTASGTIYSSLTSVPEQTDEKNAKAGLYELQFDAPTHSAVWLPVMRIQQSGPPTDSDVTLLLGVDGNALVYNRVGDSGVHWSSTTPNP
jgi:hypothetical protein